MRLRMNDFIMKRSCVTLNDCNSEASWNLIPSNLKNGVQPNITAVFTERAKRISLN